MMSGREAEGAEFEVQRQRGAKLPLMKPIRNPIIQRIKNFILDIRSHL
jgi:hypothetical protein